ncbi:MAG: hypothetical protein J6P88_03500, partial [Clostridia bacterium]|nr:hypothetical protein [Clostridia bacterium]
FSALRTVKTMGKDAPDDVGKSVFSGRTTCEVEQTGADDFGETPKLLSFSVFSCKTGEVLIK